MIHMDIDGHSPPSRRQCCMAVKRARSPEPSSPQDRPSKRLSLNVSYAHPYHSLNIRRQLGDHSSGSSRHSSEDWVQRTGGLTIDSPILAGSLILPEQEDAHGMQKDEDMMIEAMESNTQESASHTERPRLALLQTSGYPSPFPSNEGLPNLHALQCQNQLPIPCTTLEPSGYTPLQEAPHFLASEQHHPQRSLLGPSPLMGPSINVVPPTPMERQTSQDHQQTGASLALNSSTGSPVSTAPPSPRLITSRKQPRFMMGPRADCEKCRLGVKGHFVHLD